MTVLGDNAILRFKNFENLLLQSDKVNLDIEAKLMDVYDSSNLNRVKKLSFYWMIGQNIPCVLGREASKFYCRLHENDEDGKSSQLTYLKKSVDSLFSNDNFNQVNRGGGEGSWSDTYFSKEGFCQHH